MIEQLLASFVNLKKISLTKFEQVASTKPFRDFDLLVFFQPLYNFVNALQFIFSDVVPPKVNLSPIVVALLVDTLPAGWTTPVGD